MSFAFLVNLYRKLLLLYQISINKRRALCKLSYEWWWILHWACALVSNFGMLLAMLAITPKSFFPKDLILAFQFGTCCVGRISFQSSKIVKFWSDLTDFHLFFLVIKINVNVIDEFCQISMDKLQGTTTEPRRS